MVPPLSSTKQSRSSRSHPSKSHDQDDTTATALELSTKAAADVVSSSSSSRPTTAPRVKDTSNAPADAHAMTKRRADDDDDAGGGGVDEEGWHDSCVPSSPTRAPLGMDPMIFFTPTLPPAVTHPLLLTLNQT